MIIVHESVENLVGIVENAGFQQEILKRLFSSLAFRPCIWVVENKVHNQRNL